MLKKQVLRMGNGELPMDDDEYVDIPEKCISKNDLIKDVFGEFIENGALEEMSKRVILATTNDKVYDINNTVLERLKDKGHETKLFFSVDKVDSDEPKGYIEYPDEFLHSLNESGLPPHELRLTEGCPVMLTRNLNPAIGLCNGTRMMVTKMHKHILQWVTVNWTVDTIGQYVNWTVRQLDSTSIGQYVNWTVRQLDSTSIGQHDNWTVRIYF
jgi:ATP-dependent DNA helicase PIF1